MDFKSRELQGFEKLKDFEVFQMNEQYLNERFGYKQIQKKPKHLVEQKTSSQIFYTDRTVDQEIPMTTRDFTTLQSQKRCMTLEKPFITDRGETPSGRLTKSREQRSQNLSAKVKTNQSKLRPLIAASRQGTLKGDKKALQLLVQSQRNFKLKSTPITCTNQQTLQVEQKDKQKACENLSQNQLGKSQFFPLELFDPQPDSPQTLKLLSNGPQKGYSRWYFTDGKME